MSHIPERKEKDCLNCGTIVQGRYCQNCGQENVVPHETFWHMAKHFLYDITHFDSNFFGTIHHLLFKPGFLSKEYVKGRRASYLHPIKLYVFTSAIFFLLFFGFFMPKEKIRTNLNEPLNKEARIATIAELQELMKKDTTNKKYTVLLSRLKDTSVVVTNKEVLDAETDNFRIINFTDRSYKSAEDYDSVQASLPQSERDGWFLRRLVKKEIDINNKYRENPDEAFKKLTESVLHRLPYMLFVSLPLFALILKLVYIRRKQFYFADHGVFTIHLYVFTFLSLVVIFLFDKLEKMTGWDIWGSLVFIILLVMFFYLFKAMRNFYKQNWIKTFLKFLLVAVLSLVMMLVLFFLIAFFSAFTI